MNVPSYNSDADFQRVLTEIGIELDVFTVKAMVAGYVWGLELIQPSHVIDELLLKGTDEEIVLKDKNQAMNFYGNVMGLWNEIASQNPQIVKSFRQPLASSADHKTLSLHFNSLNSDINLFLASLAETGSLDTDNKEIEKFEAELEEICKILEEHEDTIDKSKITDSERVQILNVVTKCDQKWKSIFPSMGKVLDAYRKKSMSHFREESSSASANPKVGRNDPCPCGSGKKYKKCCAADVVH